MSTTLFAAPRARSPTRRALGVTAALLASVLAVPTGSASANFGPKQVVVKEGRSIQAAIDAAEPGTKIVVKGNHVEQVWIDKSGIQLIGRNASVTLPEVTTPNPCERSFEDENGEIVVLPALICVHPSTDDFPEEPELPSKDLYLNDVTVNGFELHNPIYDAIDVYFTDRVHVSRNTAINPGCDGIFIGFSRDFEVKRNTMNGSMFCSGIVAAAAEHGSITRNTTIDNNQNGIVANDSSHIVIERNTASGSCYGINVGNPPDPGGFSATNITIKRNTTNGNNSSCFPFGPEFPLGVTGILVVGASDVLVERNTANDNVSSAPSFTAGGIAVVDWPGDSPTDPPSAVSDNVRVSRNTATGNSSAAVPVDLNLTTFGDGLEVHRNRCGVGLSAAGPEPTWCKH